MKAAGKDAATPATHATNAMLERPPAVDAMAALGQHVEDPMRGSRRADKRERCNLASAQPTCIPRSQESKQQRERQRMGRASMTQRISILNTKAKRQNLKVRQH
jgi:hypothetical protein